MGVETGHALGQDSPFTEPSYEDGSLAGEAGLLAEVKNDFLLFAGNFAYCHSVSTEASEKTCPSNKDSAIKACQNALNFVQQGASSGGEKDQKNNNGSLTTVTEEILEMMGSIEQSCDPGKTSL